MAYHPSLKKPEILEIIEIIEIPTDGTDMPDRSDEGVMCRGLPAIIPKRSIRRTVANDAHVGDSLQRTYQNL